MINKLLLQTGSRAIQYLKNFDKSTDLHIYSEFYPESSVNGRRFYNIGAGNFSHPCWTNVDGGSEYYKKLYGNINTGKYHDLFDHVPLPFESDSAELIYCSHTIGHVDDDSVNYLLKDCLRILKPGGVIRIVTPDIELYYSAWRKNDRSFFNWIHLEEYNKNIELQCLNTPLSQASTTQLFIEEFAAAASTIALHGSSKRITDEEFEHLFKEKSFEEALNYCTSLCTIDMQKQFPFRHMNWFNEKKLSNMFTDAGFASIYRSGYLQSHVQVLRNQKYFDKTMLALSLYMEAVK